MFSIEGQLKSANGLYCVKFFISLPAMLAQSAVAQSAVVRLHVVRLSACPSVTIRYRDHICWNSSKI